MLGPALGADITGRAGGQYGKNGPSFQCAISVLAANPAQPRGKWTASVANAMMPAMKWTIAASGALALGLIAAGAGAQ